MKKIQKLTIIFGIIIIGIGVCLQTVYNRHDLKNNKEVQKNKDSINILEDKSIEKAKRIILDYNPTLNSTNLEYVSRDKNQYKIKYKNNEKESIIYIVDIEAETYEVKMKSVRGEYNKK